MTPGQADHAQDELRLADQALGAARRELAAGALEDACSRLYYAAFHASRAALTLKGRHSRTHAGLIHLFEQEFGPHPLLDRLLKLRAAADYEHDRFKVGNEDVSGLIQDVERFIETCREITTPLLADGPDEPDPPPDL